MDTPTPLGKCLGCHHVEGKRRLDDGTWVRTMRYDMRVFFRVCVQTYKDLGKVDRLRKVSTPFLNEPKHAVAHDEEPGALGKDALRVLMKVLYGARMARFDLLRAVQSLTQRVSRRTKEDDRALRRLVCYIDNAIDVCLEG